MEWLDDVTVTMKTILVICAALISLTGAGAAISKWFSPLKEIREKQALHAQLLDRDKKRIDGLYELFEGEKKTSRVMCKALLAQLENITTGNSIDKLRKAKNDLQQHLIDN